MKQILKVLLWFAPPSLILFFLGEHTLAALLFFWVGGSVALITYAFSDPSPEERRKSLQSVPGGFYGCHGEGCEGCDQCSGGGYL